MHTLSATNIYFISRQCIGYSLLMGSLEGSRVWRMYGLSYVNGTQKLG